MKNTGRRTVLLLLGLLICGGGPAYGQGAPADGGQRFAELGTFELQSGEAIQGLRLGYRTLGKLNAEKSNGILWPTWLGGKSEDLLEYIGPGRVVDTTKYFVILVDAIGNGVSSSPSNSKTQQLGKFPVFTIRDMVEAEHRLVVEVLKLAHLHAVMGISMGGMQAFEWSAAHPDLMDQVIPMLGSPQSTSYDRLLWNAQIDAIEMDPNWNHGEPKRPLSKGFAVSEAIGSMNETSPEYRVTHTKAKDFDAFFAELRRNAKGNAGTAWNQIRQRQAILALDIPGEFGTTLEGAAKRIRARLLVIVAAEDHTVNPRPATQFAAAIGAPVVTLKSPCGHLSLSCVSVGPVVAEFLANPSAGRTQTLEEPDAH